VAVGPGVDTADDQVGQRRDRVGDGGPPPVQLRGDRLGRAQRTDAAQSKGFRRETGVRQQRCGHQVRVAVEHLVLDRLHFRISF
jgi:hypothetical protein